MDILTLVPGILCVLAALQGKPYSAFLSVVLPAMLLLPTGYFWIQRPIPPLNFLDCALIPLAVFMLLMNSQDWKVTRTDLWMAIFVFSTFYTDFHAGDRSEGILTLFAVLVAAVIPYMAGKLLIEQRPAGRVQTVKTFIWLLTIASIFSMSDFFAKLNLFERFFSHFYAGQSTGLGLQVRAGFGRLAGPFTSSELGGMMIFSGLILALWFRRRSYKGGPAKRLNHIEKVQGSKLWMVLFPITLYMTQSRGPWIGAILGICVAWIGLAQKPVRRAIWVSTLGLAIGIPGYLAAKDYVAGPRTDYGSERETAQYRAQLLDNYIPIAGLGGAWGWGPHFPKIGGQDSVDNEYLLIYLVQGYMGLSSFILLLLEATLSLVKAGLKTASIRDRHFSFSLLGIILGFALCIATVYLGAQTYHLFFLLIGWSQVVRSEKATGSLPQEEEFSIESTKRSLTRVYT